MLGDHPIHVVLLSRDLGETRRFYRDKLGLETVSESEDAISFRTGPTTFDVTKSKVAHLVPSVLLTRYRANYRFEPLWLTEGLSYYLEMSVVVSERRDGLAIAVGDCALAGVDVGDVGRVARRDAIAHEARHHVDVLLDHAARSLADRNTCRIKGRGPFVLDAACEVGQDCGGDGSVRHPPFCRIRSRRRPVPTRTRVVR